MASAEAYVTQWEERGRPDGRFQTWAKPVGVYRAGYVFMIEGEDGEWSLP